MDTIQYILLTSQYLAMFSFHVKYLGFHVKTLHRMKQNSHYEIEPYEPSLPTVVLSVMTTYLEQVLTVLHVCYN
jgi:hypothetical protein